MKTLLTSLLLFCVLSTQAQHPFPLNQDDVEYEFCDGEENLYLRASALSYLDILKLALIVENDGINSDVNACMKVMNDFITKNSKLAKIKNEEKKIKKLEQAFADQFVKEFSLGVNIEDAVKLGTYNGLTNALLLSSVFEAYQIPFEIKGSTETLFIYAFPKSSNICVNYFKDVSFVANEENEDYRIMFVENLRGYRYLSDEEYLNSTEDKLFAKYYDFHGGKIEKLRFIADLYGFRALQLASNGEFKEAYACTKKACKLSPTTQQLILRNEIAYFYWDALEYKKVEDVNLIVEVVKLNPIYIEKAMLTQQAERMFDKFGERRFADFEACCNLLIQGLPTDSLRQHAKLILYDQKALNFKLLAFPDSCYFYREKAYEISDRSLEYQLSLYNDWLPTLNSSIEEVEDEYIALLIKYPELLENRYFQLVNLNLLLVEAGQRISMHQYAKAEKLISSFEQEYAKYEGGLLPFEENVDNSFGSLAVYYYSKNRTAKAKELIEKGLIYAPNNFNLLQRQALLNR